MKTSEQAEMKLEAAVTRALEQRPEVTVPEGFAARVMGSLPVQRPMKPVRPVGQTVAVVVASALLVAMFVLAPHTVVDYTNFGFDMELVMLAQLVAIASWVGSARGVEE